MSEYKGETLPSESKYVLDEKVHQDGSRTIQLRSSTPFSVKKRITDRYNKKGYSATLYSDNRIEASKRMEKL